MATTLRLRGTSSLVLPARVVPPLVADGRLPSARFVASPNWDDRPAGVPVSLIVIHAISLPPEQFGGAGVQQLFTNSLDAAEHPYYAGICHLHVSAHFFIRRDGSVLQFVPADLRAWHAGVSSWDGRERCNDFSVGIELEGSDTQAFAAAQYPSLGRVIHSLVQRYPISDVAAHSDIAPGRKTDPGPYFDWSALCRALLAVDVADGS